MPSINNELLNMSKGGQPDFSHLIGFNNIFDPEPMMVGMNGDHNNMPLNS